MAKKQTLSHWTQALVNPSHKNYFLVNDALAVLTIVSIASVVLETVTSLEQYHYVFLTLEWVAVFFFSIEYIVRVVATKPTSKYIFSFFGIVDLVSIVPSFLGIGNLTFLKSARALRIMRLLRMMRLAKIGRKNLNDEIGLSIISLNVIIYLGTLFVALLGTGTLMYLVESTQPVFSSIPAGMWWSLKVFLGSITVPEPTTFLGETFYVLTRFVGLLLLGLLVGVVGNIFHSTMLSNKK